MNVVPLRACVQQYKFCSYEHISMLSRRVLCVKGSSMAEICLWPRLHELPVQCRMRSTNAGPFGDCAISYIPTNVLSAILFVFFVFRFRCSIGNGMTDAQFYR